MYTAKFSNAIITKDENGKYHFQALAATPDQTQPLDVEDEVESGVPRKESVGLDQTEADYLEYNQEYERGSGKSDEKIIPRSKGDSGITGWEKTDFAEEGANKLTSGNPDTYVQSVQENVEPASAGTAENHVAENESENLEVRGSEKTEIEQLAERIESLEKELHKEKTLRSREAIASKIVNLELSSGLVSLSESEADERIVSMAKITPAESLQRELERTRSIVAKLETSGNTIVAENLKTSAVQTGSFSKFSNPQIPTLQTMYLSSDVYDKNKHLPSSYIQNKKNAAQVNQLREVTAQTSLNRQFQK